MDDRSDSNDAPGHPGAAPSWSSGRKSAVGTARNLLSRLWFTVADGIVTELYYPRIDQAAVRDFGMFVADGKEFVSEEQHDTDHAIRWVADGVPAVHITNTCKHGRYVLHKTILTSPKTHALLQLTRLETKSDSDLHLYGRITPHLRDRGAGNRGFVGDYKGIPMLFAERDGAGMAVACSAPWLKRSAGYVGQSDGRVDLLTHRQMLWQHDNAQCGTVALTGEIDLSASGGESLIVIAFGQDAQEAGFRARQTLLHGFDAALKQYTQEWEQWHNTQRPPPASIEDRQDRASWKLSTTMLAVHESKAMRGGLIASLASPWGDTQNDQDTDGYHVVWPRDCAETLGAMAAVGTAEECARVIDFLRCTQAADGHWPQSMWLDGTPAQDGLQMDEAALPVIALDLVRRTFGDTLPMPIADCWPMVKRAAGFIHDHGPRTDEDRWEHNPGYTPFTIASEIAALLIAADLAAALGEPGVAQSWRETADEWEASIDAWLYVTDTDLARRIGVEGYYVRIAAQDAREVPLKEQRVSLANTHPTRSVAAIDLVSPDALALVRFGLRDANDPRIVNTAKVIDALCKAETARGPAWHRYNGDCYGEHADGSAFNHTGIGRAWPMLTGERAHYELAAGRTETAWMLLKTLERFAQSTGLISEQVWDAPDLPSAGLFNGRPTYSACPLVWAHAEHIKLLRSLSDGRLFDLPPQPFERYVKNHNRLRHS